MWSEGELKRVNIVFVMGFQGEKMRRESLFTMLRRERRGELDVVPAMPWLVPAMPWLVPAMPRLDILHDSAKHDRR